MAASSKLRFALIGCGKIAERHGAVVKEAIEGAELAAVVDLDTTRAQEAGARWGCKAYSSIDAMLGAEKPDVVSVLTDSGSHARIALELMGRAPNIIVEKPMALRVSDADSMIEAAARTGSRLFVVKQVRFFKPVQKVREYFDQGRFGRLVMGSVRVRYTRMQEYYDSAPWRGTWAHDGGVIANQAIHLIDLLMWFMGEVKSVNAYAATRLLRMEAEDTAVAVLRFTSGALGVIEATVATRPKDLEGSVSVLGEGGTVEIGGFAANRLTRWQFTGENEADSRRILEQFAVNPPERPNYGHEEYLRAVVRAIRNKIPFPVEGAAGRESLRVVDAIYASAEQGREIRLDTPYAPSKLGRA